jgi:hypothetical protein
LAISAQAPLPWRNQIQTSFSTTMISTTLLAPTFLSDGTPKVEAQQLGFLFFWPNTAVPCPIVSIDRIICRTNIEGMGKKDTTMTK